MALTRPKIPSFVLCAADSSSSLASMVTLHTLDTDEMRPSSMRGVARTFGKKGVDKALTAKSPRIPKRKSSVDMMMNFRRVPSSFEINHQSSMKNARFDLNSKSLFQTTSDHDKPSLFLDRFGGCLETIQSSPAAMTRKSVNSDTPLTLPSRKPSEQSCSQSPSHRNINRQSNILSGLQNATFDTDCLQEECGQFRRISNITL